MMEENATHLPSDITTRQLIDLPSDITTPQWIDLPSDITANILRRLEPYEILNSVQYVCKKWLDVCRDPSMWRVIRLKPPCTEAVGRIAVERSQGQLGYLNIGRMGDDDFLRRIVPWLTGLKSLTLYVSGVTEVGLYDAARNLPHLEELHLFDTRVDAACIQHVGTFCPDLKAFSYHRLWWVHGLYEHDAFYDPNNEYALAIANSMPNLCYLSLSRCLMDKDGLEAILDGCPKLETLNVTSNVHLHLDGDIGERCRAQIKYLITDEFYEDFF